jgi:AraC-like DNA-binding protein
MTFNPLHPHAPVRVLHSLRGHQCLNPVMALLEVDTHHHWLELALLPLDLVTVCISCDHGIEFAPSTGRAHHLSLVAPLRHTPITCRTRGRARLAGVTPRQLRRDFAHWLGVSPIEYRRVVRLQRSLGHIAQGVPLASIAASQGYADQAHMTREIFDWTGIVPSQVSTLQAAPALAALQRALDGRVALVHPATSAMVEEMPS